MLSNMNRNMDMNGCYSAHTSKMAEFIPNAGCLMLSYHQSICFAQGWMKIYRWLEHLSVTNLCCSFL